MDTTMRKAVDSKEKKVWVRPFLTRLEVAGTAAKPTITKADGCYSQNDCSGVAS